MITVKLYGLLRLNSGIKERRLEAATVKEALTLLAREGIPPKELEACVILLNGKNTNKKARLADGDTLILMSPVAGG